MAGALRLREERQDLLVGGGVDVGEVAPAPGPHEEKEVEDLGAFILLRVERQLHREQILRPESRIGIQDAREALDQKSGAD